MTDFYGLDANGQAQCMAQLAQVAAAEWAMDVAQLELIKYRENAVFKLTTTAGTPFALRIHRAGRPVAVKRRRPMRTYTSPRWARARWNGHLHWQKSFAMVLRGSGLN